MDPERACAEPRGQPAPRARGDGPACLRRASGIEDCSPRTRGWTRRCRSAGRRCQLLPAHAGMDPRASVTRADHPPAPRARGDGPPVRSRVRPGSGCSPRTRGWTRPRVGEQLRHRLLPAHAGMDPPRSWAETPRSAAPRARGDGPRAGIPDSTRAFCSPRTRGWTPAPALGHQGPQAAPRARGDGPWSLRHQGGPSPCSPRTRGWTHGPPSPGRTIPLLPAHAGMDPGEAGRGPCGSAAPGARGDGPSGVVLGLSTVGCSPRTRGWTQLGHSGRGLQELLPAHAGMDPGSRTGGRTSTSAPRARGMDPATTVPSAVVMAAPRACWDELPA